jgi:hypothetical protein
MMVTEIYNKLPKTNCGECGEATCIALALKVQTGQRRLSDCPYTEGDSGQGESGEVVQDSYEEAGNRLEAKLPDADFESSAQAIGGNYDSSRDAIDLSVLGRQLEVRREGLFESGQYCHDSWDRLIVYDYVLRKGQTPMSGEYVPFEHFPKTPSHVKSFQKRAEDELGRAYGEDAAALREKIAELGGVDCESDAGADHSFQIDLLPRFPLLVRFWGADEDFPASSKISVDRNVIEYLDIEYIARLIAKCVSLLVGHRVS